MPLPASPLVFVFVALFTLICAVALALGLRELRLAWRVLGNEPDSVLDAPDGGWVELVGTAQSDGGTIRSPFTDSECLVHEYEVEERRHDQHGPSWTTIATGRQSVPFRIEDDTGSARVEPPGADLRLSRERRITVDGGDRPPDPIARFIEADDRVDDQERSIDLRVIELETGKDRRFTERRLDVGEEVHVLGTARFDTTAGRRSGEVNAVVGLDEAALSGGRLRWYRHRLFGAPFLISDTGQRGTARRVALVGAAATLGGGLGLALLGLLAL